MLEIAAGDTMVFLCRLLTQLYSYLSKMNEMIYIYMVFYMCNLVHENSVKVCEVRIFNKAICTAFWNGGRIR